jgi:hypothetical protein
MGSIPEEMIVNYEDDNTIGFPADIFIQVSRNETLHISYSRLITLRYLGTITNLEDPFSQLAL